MDIGREQDDGKQYKLSVNSSFLLTEAEVDKRFFVLYNQFPKSMMQRFLSMEGEDIAKTWKEFGIPNRLTKEYMQQLVRVANTKDHACVDWIKQVWGRYMNGSLADIAKNQAIGEFMLSWFEQKKIHESTTSDNECIDNEVATTCCFAVFFLY